MCYEHRFYRPTHPAISDVGPLQLAVIPVEDADYWNEVDAGIIIDEGEAIHFDTLYEDYIDSLLVDTCPVLDKEFDEEPVYSGSCYSLDEGYGQVTRDYAL